MKSLFTQVDPVLRLFDRLRAGFAAGSAVVALTVAGVAGAADEGRITAEMLLAGAPLEISQIPHDLVQDEEVLAVSDEMRTFLDIYVDNRSRDMFRLQQLTYAIINEGTLVWNTPTRPGRPLRPFTFATATVCRFRICLSRWPGRQVLR